jgi:hypothetical protein
MATTLAHPAYRSSAAAHYYHNAVYHREVEHLEQTIRVRQAEIAALKRQLREWGAYDRFRNGRPLMVTIENTRLILMEAQYDLECLEQQLFDLVRSRGRF